MFSIGSGDVSWNSKKQSIIALSSTEAKYRGATIIACEIIWLQKLFIFGTINGCSCCHLL
jgi:hypothetical protein